MKIHVIIGSTRPERFSEKPAHWIAALAAARQDMEVELVDLRNYPLPFFDEPTSPSMATKPFTNPKVKAWTKKVSEADGYIVVTAEYNHSVPAVLKNAFDYVYKEWNNKPIGFVSYGSVMGARVIEQARLIAVELQMAPIRTSINIPGQIYMEARGLETAQSAKAFASLDERATMFLDQLAWWTKALKVARENT